MNEIEMAWLAGLLEGEGTFGCYLRGRSKTNPILQLVLQTTDEDIARRAALLMENRPVSWRDPKDDKIIQGRLRVWIAIANGYTAARVMDSILPLMGSRRTAVIVDALARWRARPKKNREPRLPPTCHPDRKHRTHGLCAECYKLSMRKPPLTHEQRSVSARPGGQASKAKWLAIRSERSQQHLDF